MDLTAEQIARVLINYKKKRERENKYYHEITKNKEEFKIKNRQRAKDHYHNGYKDKKKENYINNKELLKNKSLFNYYKKKDKIDIFKEKHEDKFKMLVEKGIIE
tara:strand:+ start:162 stop:473 length:312 start_codon:yes stop_codon:yes gene_type:complete